MKNISVKKIAIIAVAVVTCVVLGFAAFILFREDKPVFTPAVNTHELNVNSEGVIQDDGSIKFDVGPDITGSKYAIKLDRAEDEFALGHTYISINGGEKQEVNVDFDNIGHQVSGYLVNALSVIDDKGNVLIVVNMDTMSEDFVFVIYTIKDGKLVRCDSDDALMLSANTDRTFTAGYPICFFGSWSGERTLKLTGANKIQIQDGDYMLADGKDRPFTVKKAVKATLADENGEYKSVTLKKGSKIIPYATDGKSYLLFTDENGNKGKLNGKIKDGYTILNGKDDSNWFDGLVYAG